MCSGCWDEAGRPMPDRPETHEAARLVGKIYDLPRGSCGGLAHIVVDDWNCEDDSIDFCLRECEKEPEGATFDGSPELVAACVAALNALRALPIEQRYAALAAHDGYDPNRQPEQPMIESLDLVNGVWRVVKRAAAEGGGG